MSLVCYKVVQFFLKERINAGFSVGPPGPPRRYRTFWTSRIDRAIRWIPGTHWADRSFWWTNSINSVFSDDSISMFSILHEQCETVWQPQVIGCPIISTILLERIPRNNTIAESPFQHVIWITFDPGFFRRVNKLLSFNPRIQAHLTNWINVFVYQHRFG